MTHFLNCSTMRGAEQPREWPEIGDRVSSPVAVNHFFFLLGLHVLALFL